MISVMQHVDKRVRRTRKLLGEALIELSLEKGYDDITIQEITQRADIGYRTFFRHYSDKEELLKDVLSATLLELQDLMTSPPLENFINPNFSATDFKDLTILFQHVNDHRDLYQILLHSNQEIIQTVTEFAEDNIQSRLENARDLDIPIDLISNHLVAVPIAMLRWWLEADMPYSPEKMGEYAFQLIVMPFRDMVIQTLNN